MLASLLLTGAVASLAAALPAVNIPRAGGPSAVPIPAGCTVTNTLPLSQSGETYQPANSTTSSLTYYAYYDLPQNVTQQQEFCLEQCNGFYQCVSAYHGYNMVVPAGYYGTAGGNLEQGCLFFNRTLTEEDFVVAPAGQYTDAFVGNILCKELQ